MTDDKDIVIDEEPTSVTEEKDKSQSSTKIGEEGGYPSDLEKGNAERKEENETEKPKRRFGLWRGIKNLWSFIKKILRAPRELIYGRVISVDWIIKHWKPVLTIFLMLIIYIANRYSCQKNQAEITLLKEELKEISYRSLETVSNLNLLQREDSVIKKIEFFGLDLQHPNHPPYIIEQTGYEKE